MRKTNQNKALIIGLIVALAVICSVGGVAVIVKKSHSDKSEKTEPRKGHTSLVPLGEMTFTLADPHQLRYLKTDLVLEVRGSVGKDLENDLKTRARDAVIAVVSSKHLAELLDPNGKSKLKEQIIEVVNQRVDGIEAVNVYFNEFAMQ